LDALARNAGAWIHDMRHAFQIIGLKAEMLGELPAESRVGRVVDELSTSVREASTLCERALQVGRRVSSLDSVALRSLLVREASAAASISGRRDRVRISIDCADDLTVHTDAPSIARVVRNLVLNAIEASPDGSEVELRARAHGDTEYELSVSDRGRGMCESDLQRLLRCGQSGGSGTGFGTSSMAECVLALRGRMEFESRLGVGTSARIVLPNAKESDRAGRVIVLCGDRRRRGAIARSFESFGWHAIEAVDGEEALDRLAQSGPTDVALVRGTPGEGVDAVCEAVLGFDRRLAVLSIADGGAEKSVERAIRCFRRTSRCVNALATRI
jgi:two-component sensor histidine kinase